jgi:hypothetical protein
VELRTREEHAGLRQQGPPPDYELTQIRIPTQVFLGNDNLLVSTADIELLLLSEHGVRRTAHIDFVTRIDAAKLVYNLIVDEMEKIIAAGENKMGANFLILSSLMLRLFFL